MLIEESILQYYLGFLKKREGIDFWKKNPISKDRTSTSDPSSSSSSVMRLKEHAVKELKFSRIF